MALTFTEALMQAKRKSHLSGRPLSKMEASGIAEGYAAKAGDQAYRLRALTQEKDISEERLLHEKDIQSKALEQQKFLQAETLAQQKELESQRLAQRKREQDDMRDAAESEGRMTGAIGGAIAGGSIGGPIGAVVGGIVGFVAGGSYLCNTTHKNAGLNKDILRALSRFRAYVLEHHKEPLRFYLKHGPALIKAISEQEKNLQEFYKNLKENFVIPIVVLSDSSHQEEAYQVYTKTTSELIKKYLPDVYDEGMKIVKNDQMQFEEAA